MDISTSYLGLKLKSPIVPSASPLSKDLDSIKIMAESGAGAIVMHSLFEEQINANSLELDHFLSSGTESFSEALDYFPEMDSYSIGPESYLDHIRQIKRAVGIPVIGSLNGVSIGGWIEYAQLIEQAGADALELNIYYIPTSLFVTGEEIEAMYLENIKAVCDSVSIPVAVKFGPSFSSIPNMTKKMVEAGAKGLVMFNRFYQPDIDVKALEIVPNLVLSNSSELRLPLRWTAILYNRIQADIAITSGIHSGLDVVKGIFAGANVTMVASELLMKGPQRLRQMTEELKQILEENEYESVSQMRGSMSQMNISEPAAFERANYMKVLNSWTQDPTGKLL